MKKPIVDYRNFRLHKINDPEFAHLKYLIGWIGYFFLYFITENFIPVKQCYVIHSRIDDLIPFCEFFVIPYVFWYFLIVASLLYFALYNVKSFKQLMKFIIITQIVAMIIYIIFPNRQDLRPDAFATENILTKVVSFLYSFDTNTNVCPSLHVAISIGIASVWLKEKDASLILKIFILVSAVTICLSTVFIKQHSVIDGFVAIILCLFAEIIVYGKDYWIKKFKTK